MKKLSFLLYFIHLISFGQAQELKGKIIVEHINSSFLQNTGGENPVRRVTIYLPPNYDHTTNRYPVIYYLHGFTWNDSLQIAVDHFDQLLDKAINTGKIKPVIVVIPNTYTEYRGSWHTNSTLTGKWADFTTIGLVTYIDEHYRTIADKQSRGIAGHSSGGYGAIKLGMLSPGVFSCVYALSPATLALFKEFGASGTAFRRAQSIRSKEELITGYNDFLANAVVAMGRAYTPNASKPPFYCDLPFTYKGDTVIVNEKVLEAWNKNSPVYMVDQYADNIRKLKALKLDWGRNDHAEHIPLTCRMFSQKLESLGINHYAEEYIGDHGNKLWTDDGRALNDMLPFFNTYLKFQELKFKMASSSKRAKNK
jgi:enterochelin esterase-like enzyme